MNPVQDAELFRKILGVEPPWSVARVDLSVKDQRIDVWLEHADGVAFPCPQCGKKLTLYDQKEEREWRHLDTMQLQTWVHAKVPRVECPDHGVKQVEVSWAESGSRFTKFFERFAIDVSQETDTKGASKILRLSWDESWGIQERAVARGMARKPPLALRLMGVDEKAVGHGHQYMTLVYDLERSTVEWIGEERKRETLDNYFRTLSEAQRRRIEAVGMDMWVPFIESVRANVPDAEGKIVFDRFHIMQHAGVGVDLVRKKENRELLLTGDPTLKGSKYLWLYREKNLPEKHRDRFEELRSLHLKTGRAYALKEGLGDLWSYQSEGWARKYWRRWYWWATHSRLKPMADVARMVKDHLTGVMTYFTHRITNAVAEGLNSKIATIQKMAYGYRNKDHFRTAVLFRCGGLDLYPSNHPISG
ncbi:MAG: ISL3 family transposase [Thermoplasmata archaeon]|nr:ISL3 family transposase [Thermoplasmata archaeon]